MTWLLDEIESNFEFGGVLLEGNGKEHTANSEVNDILAF